MPEKLLTTREVVNLLQLDRVTIYKMVKDGELPALRLGGQWRFSERALGDWLQVRHGETLAGPIQPHAAPAETADLSLTDLVPVATLQAIQNQFAELLGVSSFITDLDGRPLAPCSRCSRFCQLVHTHPEGWDACRASWRAIAQADQEGATVHTCHAGVQYASAPVIVNGRKLGMVTAGQFFTEPPDSAAFRAKAQETGAALRVDGDALAAAMDSIEQVDHDRAVQITNLLAAIANAISSIGYQSHQMHKTLAQIAQLTDTAREVR